MYTSYSGNEREAVHVTEAYYQAECAKKETANAHAGRQL